MQVTTTMMATNHEHIFPVNSEKLSKLELIFSKVNLFFDNENLNYN